MRVLKRIVEILAELFGVGKENIYDEIQTGRLQEVLPKIKRKLNSIITNGNYSWAYVGRTSNVNRRISQHKSERGKFDSVYVIYKTQSFEYVKRVENGIIEYLKEGKKINLLNKSSGSPGPKGKPPYYVYVAFRG